MINQCRKNNEAILRFHLEGRQYHSAQSNYIKKSDEVAFSRATDRQL